MKTTTTRGARRKLSQRRKPAKLAGAVKPKVRELQRQATRNAILQSALHIFSEHGFQGGSTRDIATHARVHHALIKYHFHTKDALWREAVNFLFQRQAVELKFERPIGNLNTRKGRREYAQEVLRLYVLYCSRHPEHARLMMQECLRDGPRLEWAAKTYGVSAAQIAERFVKLLQQDGILPNVSIPSLIYIIVGGAQLFFTLGPEVRRVWGIDPRNEAVIVDHIEAVLAVLMR
jgi:TetR/AcrR family transcriptional regulator